MTPERLGQSEGLPVTDVSLLVLPCWFHPLEYHTIFIISISPSLRGPGAGRPWPNPNSANSVSIQVQWVIGSQEVLGAGWLLSSGGGVREEEMQ